MTNVNGTIPGAIRWDAWYGTGVVNQAVSYSLSPAAYHARAPWFAQTVSPNILTINGNQQATMDAEINYAAGAGLKYWAYVWYSATDPMQLAWNLHQSSSIKNNMNWCLLLQFSGMASSFTPSIPTYVTYFQQANYQLVSTNRPLIYIFLDQLSALNNSPWNGSWANVQTAFNALRTAATAVGLGSPYIVLIGGTASILSQTSSDAFSGYGPPTPDTSVGAYALYDTQVQASWPAMAALGSPIILNTGVGWDPRPRFDRPPYFSVPSRKPYYGRNNYYVLPTASQLTTSLQAAVSYVVANPSIVPTKAILIYSWDECDEGGGMIPHYNPANPSVPDLTVLNAVGAVTW